MSFSEEISAIVLERMMETAEERDCHPRVGGEDFDYFDKLYKETGTDISGNLRAFGELKREVEKAKRSLQPTVYSPRDRVFRIW